MTPPCQITIALAEMAVEAAEVASEGRLQLLCCAMVHQKGHRAGRERGGKRSVGERGGGTRLSESLCKHNEGSQNKCPVAATPTGADLQLDGGGVRLAAEENAVEVGVERCAETTYKLGTAGAGHHICCNPS